MRIAGMHGYLLTAAALAVICAVYYYVDPSQCALAPKCVVKLATGVDCPGCGFQRALHALLHGHFRKAIDYNPFLLVGVATICLWVGGQYLLRKAANCGTERRLARLNRGVVYLYILCYFSWFILRNIPKT